MVQHGSVFTHGPSPCNPYTIQLARYSRTCPGVRPYGLTVLEQVYHIVEFVSSVVACRAGGHPTQAPNKERCFIPCINDGGFHIRRFVKMKG